MTDFNNDLDDEVLRNINLPETNSSDGEVQTDQNAKVQAVTNEEVHVSEARNKVLPEAQERQQMQEVCLQQKVPEVVKDKQNEAVEPEFVYSLREYRKIFIQSNKKYGLSKVHGSVSPEIFYVRPRNRMPPAGMPVLFVAEGLQRANNNSLICPGRCFLFGQSKMFVTLGTIWVSCL